MSISQLFLTVNSCNFRQLGMSFSVFKQQIIKDVQQFWSSFLKFDFYMQYSYRTLYTVTIGI